MKIDTEWEVERPDGYSRTYKNIHTAIAHATAIYDGTQKVTVTGATTDIVYFELRPSEDGTPTTTYRDSEGNTKVVKGKVSKGATTGGALPEWLIPVVLGGALVLMLALMAGMKK